MKRLAWLACPIALLLAIGLIAFEGPCSAAHLLLLMRAGAAAAARAPCSASSTRCWPAR